MRIRVVLASAVWTAASFCALAQSFPEKPVKVVVPYPPGGNSDIVARLVSASVSQTIGQPLIIENRAGAGGASGADYVAKSAPDGYSLLVVITSYAAQRAWTPAFDFARDFVPVALLASTPSILVVRQSAPFGSLKDLVNQAKANPGKLRCASSWIGDVSRLACEQMEAGAGLRFTHVPFKGYGPMMQSLVDGHVDLALAPLDAALPHVKAGRLKALAVTSSRRTASLPAVPTFNDAGYSLQVESLVGVVAPAGTRNDIVRKLNAEFTRAIRSPEVARRLEQLALSPIPDTLGHFAGTPSQRSFGPTMSGGTVTCNKSKCPCNSGCDDDGCCKVLYPRPPN